MEERDEIEEGSDRVVSRSGSDSRWVDGSQVETEIAPSSLRSDNGGREGYGSLRRRLIKKPKRADSFDVEAMEIAGAYSHHSKVITLLSINSISVKDYCLCCVTCFLYICYLCSLTKC